MISAGMTNIMTKALVDTVNENQRLSVANNPRLTKKKAGQAWKIAKMEAKAIITAGFFKTSFIIALCSETRNNLSGDYNMLDTEF